MPNDAEGWRWFTGLPAPEPLAPDVIEGRALSDTRCARRRSHRINKGDRIAFVPGLGWCCDLCAT